MAVGVLMLYKASAPGSVMLLGEHAVLHDKRAIVLAIERRIVVALSPRTDQKIYIHSDLGSLETNIDDCAHAEKPFDFVMAVIALFQECLAQRKQGFDLNISSQCDPEVGLGSSAAVCVAVSAVLYQWLSQPPLKGVECISTRGAVPFKRGAGAEHPGGYSFKRDEQALQQIFQTALQAVRAVQGLGSGADVAASVWGGALLYQQQGPYPLQHLGPLPALSLVYSGSKIATPIVVRQVQVLYMRYSKLIGSLYAMMDQLVQTALEAIAVQDWPALGELMQIQGGLMKSLGVETAPLAGIITALNQQTGIYGAKISGSGLGDCVIGLGRCAQWDDSIGRLIPIACAIEGLFMVESTLV